MRRRLAYAPAVPAARRGAPHEKGSAWGEVRRTDMQQQASRFWRRMRPAPLVFLCRNPGAFWSPDSGRKIKPRFRAYVLKQYMGSESGLDFAPGIWAPKCARIPARTPQKSRLLVRQWCGSGANRPPPEKRIPSPNTDRTSVCQFHYGCNLQQVRQAVTGLLAMSGLKCAKQFLSMETITATPGNGTLSPKTVPRFRA